MTAQLKRAFHIMVKDMRTYYLKPPVIGWGMLFPIAMILAFSLRDPTNVRAVAPGLIGMTVLFGATSMEAVVIAFEKRIGAMERLLLAPVSPSALVIGKAASGAVFGTVTGCVVAIISSLIWGLPLALCGVLVTVLLGSITFSLLGVLISLLMHEVFDAMTLSNFLCFPMVFLCGVFLPLAEMPAVVRSIAAGLPLTYTVDALRHLLLQGEEAYFTFGSDLIIVVLFALILYATALRLTVHRLEDLI